ncbi:MAG: sensor histidine kinase [Chitinophagaceae bacterium]|nr:MAG: sensor histidine kinase [Chitinophagaceae bacterium]
MKSFCLILLGALHFSLSCIGQPGNSLPSILQLKDDSTKVNKLNAYAEQIMAFDPQQAIRALNQSVELSKSIQYPLGTSIAYAIRATMFIYEMKLDSANLLLQQGSKLIQQETAPTFLAQQASIQQKLGSVLQQRQLYDSAINKYLAGAELYRRANKEDLGIVGFYNIALMYGLLNQPDKALYYAREVNRIALKTGNAEFITRSYIALGDAFHSLKEYDSVFYYSEKGLAQPDTRNNAFVTGKFQQLRGIYFLKGRADFKTALTAFDSALHFFEKINLAYEKAMILQNMSNAYLLNKDYTNALQYGSKAVALARDHHMYEVQARALTDMWMAAEAAGDVKAAYQYLREFTLAKDTLEQLNRAKIVNELEAKYQSQKKEAMLQAQQSTIYKKNLLNYILIGSALTLLLFFLLAYYSYRQKQKLQQQRIAELETQQQLYATEAVLKGEEQERTRLAKDLHDGLGGMLSGIKYSFTNMKGNMVMTPENKQAFERSMDMLDSSINEMRRVAHNMMPEVLLKFGLDKALRDFCNDINNVSLLKITYQSHGLSEQTFPQTTAIALYRIVQELINNSLKHAAATNAIVQLFYQAGQLSLTVEDDGKGFNPEVLTESAGIGWSNIQHRVDFLKGRMDIQSGKDKGTSVHIEIDIT